MTFDLQPTLKGDRVELRPLCADDYQDLYEVASDPLIWEQHPERDRHKEEVFERFFRDALESGGALVVIDPGTGKVIGSSRYHGYDEDKDEVEIGWTFLARSYWGGVHNSEMKQLMLQHAFQFVSNVVFMIGPDNIRSQRAVQKIGAVRLGSRSDAVGRNSVAFGISAARHRDET